jgi:phage FluMu protein Com
MRDNTPSCNHCGRRARNYLQCAKCDGFWNSFKFFCSEKCLATHAKVAHPEIIKPPPLPSEIEKLDFSCPDCLHRMKYLAKHGGKAATCPKCKSSITLPQAQVAVLPEVSESVYVDDEESDEPRNLRCYCRKCKKAFMVAESLGGQVVKCPRCKADADAPHILSRTGFRCIHCGSRQDPVTTKVISTGGIVFVVIAIIICFPFALLGLAMTDKKSFCRSCGIEL